VKLDYQFTPPVSITGGFMNRIFGFHYPATVEHFRAFMDGFFLPEQGRWLADSGNVYHIWHERYLTLPKREIWVATREMPIVDGKRERYDRAATIFALEDSPNLTHVQLIDGKAYHGSPPRDNTTFAPISHITDEGLMDADLEGLYNAIREAIRQRRLLTHPEIPDVQQTDATQEPNSSNLWDWFDWYHANKSKFRIKMNYIAEKAGFELSTVYKEHSIYMDSKGISPKKVKKSKKK
jgi:hypothetical protein